MSHAIALNLCPFCGGKIFAEQEFAFRKALSKILVKNSLEDEDKISSIINDIVSYINEQVSGKKTTSSHKPEVKLEPETKPEVVPAVALRSEAQPEPSAAQAAKELAQRRATEEVPSTPPRRAVSNTVDPESAEDEQWMRENGYFLGKEPEGVSSSDGDPSEEEIERRKRVYEQISKPVLRKAGSKESSFRRS
jgi:hypothetical protein